MVPRPRRAGSGPIRKRATALQWHRRRRGHRRSALRRGHHDEAERGPRLGRLASAFLLTAAWCRSLQLPALAFAPRSAAPVAEHLNVAGLFERRLQGGEDGRPIARHNSEVLGGGCAHAAHGIGQLRTRWLGADGLPKHVGSCRAGSACVEVLPPLPSSGDSTIGAPSVRSLLPALPWWSMWWRPCGGGGAACTKDLGQVATPVRLPSPEALEAWPDLAGRDPQPAGHVVHHVRRQGDCS